MRNQRLFWVLALIGATASLATACGGSAQSGKGEAEAPVTFQGTPTLVAVDSTVWVVRDYDQAVYYSDGYYWTYRDTWHRSRSYDAGWEVVEVDRVPAGLKTRDHTKFVHYHGDATAQTHAAPRGGETLGMPEPHTNTPVEAPKAAETKTASHSHAHAHAHSHSATHAHAHATHRHPKKGTKNVAKRSHKKDHKNHA